MNLKVILSYAFLVFMFWTCSKIEDPPADNSNYFPAEIGKYWIYEVDSSWYDPFTGNKNSLHYFVKDFVESSFIDTEGNTNYRVLSTYSIDSMNGIWNFKNYYTIVKAKSYDALIWYNLRIVKQSYPIKNLKVWDENEFNVLPYRQNRYRNLSQEFGYADQLYLNTIEVDRSDVIDPIFEILGKSIYANDLGLIYSEDTNTEKQNGKKKGSEFNKILVEHNW